jgi:SAM-dependent methyltransferase
MTGLEHRSNVAERREERWRPPPFAAEASSWKAALRRAFDLQAGSVHRDLASLLASARGTVLDVGCGAQPYRGLIPRECRYVAIDTVSAKERFGYEVPGTSYYDGPTWPVADGSADVVLCTEVLEHVLDTSGFLAEMFRSTAPGGRIVLTVPFAARWHFVPHDYWRFTPSSLKALLEKAGFASVRVYARGDHVTVACYKAMALCLHFLMPQGRGVLGATLERIVGLVTLPAFFVLTAIGNLSLLRDGGDDCLGYTVLADRPASP